MSRRIRLIHWSPEQAEARITQLRAAGYEVDYEPMPLALRKAILDNPPEAFAIDLTRLPSHGRDVGLSLRQRKSTRYIPLVFLGGEPEKVERVRRALPDASYAQWSGFRSALKSAMARPVATPLVPSSVMAGYSGTPLPKKLGIKPGTTVALLGAPDDFERTLGDVPDGVEFRSQLRDACDLALWFVRSSRDLDAGIGRISAAVPDGGIWIIWPKKTSGIQTDVSEPVVRQSGLAHGLVDFKICAVDATWSGLKFARRKSK